MVREAGEAEEVRGVVEEVGEEVDVAEGEVSRLVSSGENLTVLRITYK